MTFFDIRDSKLMIEVPLTLRASRAPAAKLTGHQSLSELGLPMEGSEWIVTNRYPDCNSGYLSGAQRMS